MNTSHTTEITPKTFCYNCKKLDYCTVYQTGKLKTNVCFRCLNKKIKKHEIFETGIINKFEVEKENIKTTPHKIFKKSQNREFLLLKFLKANPDKIYTLNFLTKNFCQFSAFSISGALHRLVIKKKIHTSKFKDIQRFSKSELNLKIELYTSDIKFYLDVYKVAFKKEISRNCKVSYYYMNKINFEVNGILIYRYRNRILFTLEKYKHLITKPTYAGAYKISDGESCF